MLFIVLTGYVGDRGDVDPTVLAGPTGPIGALGATETSGSAGVPG